MAALELRNGNNLKGNKIHVDVEEALEDLFVVSYTCENKTYQGVLLDCTKMGMPHGIIPPFCAFGSITPNGDAAVGETAEGGEKKQENFSSLRQRFTYFQQKPNEYFNILHGSITDDKLHAVQRRKRPLSKDNKPTRAMRLRPRQVLCSKCKSICNENSENVESIAKTNNGQNKQISRSDFGMNTSPRLTLSERSNSNMNPIKNGPEINLKNSPIQHSLVSSPRALDRCDVNAPRLVEKMILRKRKSDQMISDGTGNKSLALTEEWTKKVTNHEGLQNETSPLEHQPKTLNSTNNILPAPKLIVSRNEVNDTFEAKVINKDDKSESVDEQSNIKSVTNEKNSEPKYPVLKISFTNPKGEGTVMKIPRRIGPFIPPSPVHSDDQGIFRLSNRPNFSPNPHKDDASAKAAKKALKKAKKEAQKKALNSAGHSLNSDHGLMRTTPNNSPHHKIRSKHHHKHKLKHKRKHKDEDKWTKNNSSGPWNKEESTDENRETNKYRCVNLVSNRQITRCEDSSKQKLSISLKRLNEGSYCAAPTDEILRDYVDESNDAVKTGIKGKSLPSESSSNSSDSTEYPLDSVSDSEQLNKIKPLMMRITTHNVNKTYVNRGRVMCVGDIVWGKIQGFPWWPGKILAIIVSQRDNGAQTTQQAHVTWYGSSISSYMLCHRLLPFLEEFEHRYNKKKRGPYKEAIRQATEEAKHLDVTRLKINSFNKRRNGDKKDSSVS